MSTGGCEESTGCPRVESGIAAQDDARRVRDPGQLDAVPALHDEPVPSVAAISTKGNGAHEVGARAVEHLSVFHIRIHDLNSTTAGCAGVVGQGEGLVVVLDIHHHGRADLLAVAQAGGLARFLARAGEDGEQDGRQDRDDRDDDQQLDERKAPASHLSFTSFHRLSRSDSLTGIGQVFT